MLEMLQATAVGCWDPPVAISSQVRGAAAIDNFLVRLRAGYTAPKVDFREPEALAVMGRHFAVITERNGLCPDSIHTVGQYKWHQAFAKVRNIRLMLEGSLPPLIAASSGYGNYYHWTAETVGTLLIHRLLSPESSPSAIIPAMTRSWQREALEIFDLPSELIEIAETEAAVLDQAILTNITARDFGIYPHPSIARHFRNLFPMASMPRSHGKLIYASRLDEPNRRTMTNEEELCAMLSRHGFEILVPGTMPVKDQASAFAQAALIVAPHGAALGNLYYADEGQAGPAVIELQQEGYLSGGFAKLSQAKSLDYSVIVNPCTDPGAYHHHSVWRADLELIERMVVRKIEEIGSKL